jgi:hypothetical protein
VANRAILGLETRAANAAEPLPIAKRECSREAPGMVVGQLSEVAAPRDQIKSWLNSLPSKMRRRSSS